MATDPQLIHPNLPKPRDIFTEISEQAQAGHGLLNRASGNVQMVLSEMGESAPAALLSVLSDLQTAMNACDDIERTAIRGSLGVRVITKSLYGRNG